MIRREEWRDMYAELSWATNFVVKKQSMQPLFLSY